MICNICIFLIIQNCFRTQGVTESQNSLDWKEDLLHDLTRHGDEADWLVVPKVLFILSQNGHDVSIFQALGASRDCNTFSNIIEWLDTILLDQSNRP